MKMTELDKEIFRTTRRLTTLLNEAFNRWYYLCPYLEKLEVAADRALEGYQKDNPDDVNTIIAEDRKTEIRPLRNCDVGSAEEQSVRMAKFCQEQYEKSDGIMLCSGCRFHDLEGLDCQFAWAQMPYDEGKNNEQ